MNIIKPFNVGHDLRRISTREFMRQTALEAALSQAEDLAFAGDRARAFMRDFFAGKKSVQCQCGKVVKFRNDTLCCSHCGRTLDRIEFIEDYQCGRFFKTVVDVKKREYSILENVP